MRGWERKKARRKEEKKSLFRTAKESLPGRIKKKTIGKSNWFRRKKDKKLTEEAKNDHASSRRGGSIDIAPGVKKMKSSKSSKSSGEEEPETAAVLFVEGTKESILAKNLREVIEKIKMILGYRIKVVERSGTP